MLAIMFFDNDGLQTHVDHMLCTMLCLVPFPLQMTTERKLWRFGGWRFCPPRMGDFLPFLVVTPQLGWCTAWLAHSCPPIRLYSFQRRIQVAAETRGFVELRFQVPTSSEICPLLGGLWISLWKTMRMWTLLVLLHCTFAYFVMICVRVMWTNAKFKVNLLFQCKCQININSLQVWLIFFPHSKCSVALAIACVFASARCPCWPHLQGGHAVQGWHAGGARGGVSAVCPDIRHVWRVRGFAQVSCEQHHDWKMFVRHDVCECDPQPHAALKSNVSKLAL